ncbi:MAG: isochorismatase family protein [bacterium]
MSWRLEISKTALLVVDAQEKAMAALGDALQKKLKRLIEAMSILGVPVYFTELLPQKEFGATLPTLRTLAPEGKTLTRTQFSAGEFAGEIAASTILLAGVGGHVSVRQTAYDLRLKGKTPCLVVDAIGSRDALSQQIALSEMQADKLLLTTLETCLLELVGGTQHPHYKAITRIVA